MTEKDFNELTKSVFDLHQLNSTYHLMIEASLRAMDHNIDLVDNALSIVEGSKDNPQIAKLCELNAELIKNNVPNLVKDLTDKINAIIGNNE